MRNILLIVLLICSPSPVYAAEKTPVTWYQKNFPPHVIVKGQMKGEGIDDQITKYMIKRLPEYAHRAEEANYSRISTDLKNKENVIVNPICRQPDRESYILFSALPNYLMLPNGLIINRSDKQRFLPFILKDGSLDIEALCRSRQFVIGIASGRAYSGVLDDMIKSYKDTGMFYQRSAAEYSGLMSMLLSKRIDAVFGFQVEVKYFGFEKELEVIKVSKMVPCIPVYFGTSKNEWGQVLIDRLNALVKEKGVLAEFSGYYEQLLDDKNKDYYRKLVQEYYRTNFDLDIYSEK